MWSVPYSENSTILDTYHRATISDGGGACIEHSWTYTGYVWVMGFRLHWGFVSLFTTGVILLGEGRSSSIKGLDLR